MSWHNRNMKLTFKLQVLSDCLNMLGRKIQT